jgi:acyl-CoA reductase-like NAD-dependent aldehyde dehydrogenase
MPESVPEAPLQASADLVMNEAPARRLAPEASMDRAAVVELTARQRACFASGRTRELAFRREQLRTLRSLVVDEEPRIFEALRADLGKPPVEAYGGETAIVRREIDFALRHLAAWTRLRRVRTLLAHMPGRSEVHRVPHGVVLVMSPWNFPVQLALAPLVGAIAAGNCAILKPSPLAPTTSRLLAELFRRRFDPAAVALVEGGVEVAELLLEERFDYIFFTGSAATGRRVMAAAARHLTPVTLELGGKNPCIVDADVDLEVAARRIVWGKFFNAGQSCVAVDYLLVDRRIRSALVERLAGTIREFYGAEPARSPDLARIVSEHHFDRLAGLLHRGRIAVGGKSDRAARFIEPTVIDGVAPGDPIMEEEIFGPILPVLEYGEIGEAIAFVNARPAPLALYLFSRDRSLQERVLRETSASGCVNDTVLQEIATELPFGGAGESGMGAYHGKASFELFSRPRSLVRRGFALDVRLRYPPYGDKLRLVRWLF